MNTDLPLEPAHATTETGRAARAIGSPAGSVAGLPPQPAVLDRLRDRVFHPGLERPAAVLPPDPADTATNMPSLRDLTHIFLIPNSR